MILILIKLKIKNIREEQIKMRNRYIKLRDLKQFTGFKILQRLKKLN